MNIAIIGGGPAGMFCAYTIKNNQPQIDVDLFEKNEKLGKKLNITGKGRCNITNKTDLDGFMSNIVRNNRFCYSMLTNFSPDDTISFFEQKGVKLKVERGNRVFPVSDISYDITDCLVTSIKKLGINIHTNTQVLEIASTTDHKFEIKTNKNCCLYDAVVIATGGCSYIATGSTGDGYKFAKNLNHNIIPVRPALCPIKIKDGFIKEIEGLSLKNVTLKVAKNNKIIHSEFGDLLFTSDGISGPIVLTTSSYINREQNDLHLFIDLKPALDEKKLEARILRDIAESPNKAVKSLIAGLLPASLVQPFLAGLKINENVKNNSITTQMRKDIINNLKNFKLTYGGLYPQNAAIITSGGVDVKEIDAKTMQSKILPNLYFIGEVVDVDCLTGGFNLQFAMSSAYLAAKHISGGV